MPPFPDWTPKGSPERAAWWDLYRLATRDDSLADGLFAVDPPREPTLKELAARTPPELAKYLAGLSTRDRARLRGSLRVPPDLGAARRAAILRDIQEYPEAWRPVLRDVLADDIIDLAAAVLEGVRGAA